MFTKAQRKKAKLRLALCGPSGSGKTYSALLMAQGLGGKIAMIDTERGSGELYADLCDYDVAQLEPPYTPDRYIELIKSAAEEYDVLIIDSLTHAWAGEGGVLEMHDRATAASRSKNSYAAWREVTPEHNKLVDAVLGANCHIITTMRTKTAYDMVDDGKGGKKPVKVGLAPVQRDGMEYEFTVVLDLSVDTHIATASKDRTRIFDGQHLTPSVEHGQTLKEWLENGIDVEAQKQNAKADHMAAIESAASLDALKTAFEAAIEIAKQYRDKDMQQEFINAKDDKKQDLELKEGPERGVA